MFHPRKIGKVLYSLKIHKRTDVASAMGVGTIGKLAKLVRMERPMLLDEFYDKDHRGRFIQEGQSHEDEANCGFTRWVDPKPINATAQYICYLQNRIQDLERELEDATPKPELVIGIEDDETYCFDPFCRCPHHKSGPTNPPPPPPPPPPYYGGGNDYNYSQSGGQLNYSPWE